MSAHHSTTPYAKTIILVMLAICISILGNFSFRLHEEIKAKDRYVDSALQASLEQGMPWLLGALNNGSLQESGPSCFSKNNHECARHALNELLAQATTPHHIKPDLPPVELIPHILTSIRWLRNNSSSPDGLIALLRRPPSEVGRITMGDPFRLFGCLYIGKRSNESNMHAGPCADGQNSPIQELPDNLKPLLTHINQYRYPSRASTPNTYTHRLSEEFAVPLQQGRHIWLGFDPALHFKAQITTDCYTGNSAACNQCPWCNVESASTMYEEARARAMGILVVDVASGAIEATASAFTNCYVLQQQGQPPTKNCPVLPGTPSQRAFRLGNQALMQTAMPGSQTKPVIATGLVKAGLSAKELSILPGIISKSSTEDLISLVMCKERDFDQGCITNRLNAINEAAIAMGWNSKLDIAADNQIAELRTPIFGARLLRQPDKKMLLNKGVRLSTDALRRCHNQPLKQRWRNCQGEHLVNIVAEMFGQGHSLASPVGIANGLLHLGAAHNGQLQTARTHFVSNAQHDTNNYLSVVAKHDPAISQSEADTIISGMLKTHVTGTARSACARASLQGGVLSCTDENANSPRIASKTGTPVFSGDRKPLNVWRSECSHIKTELAKARKNTPNWYRLRNELGKCDMRPVKWYAFLIGSPKSSKWEKVVVVLAERNWNRLTELIDTPDDIGPNVAAEAGLAFANAVYSNEFSARKTPAQTTLNER